MTEAEYKLYTQTKDIIAKRDSAVTLSDIVGTLRKVQLSLIMSKAIRGTVSDKICDISIKLRNLFLQSPQPMSIGIIDLLIYEYTSEIHRGIDGYRLAVERRAEWEDRKSNEE